jgi:hypothetical protein
MLEEMGLDYEVSPVELMARQANAEFMSVSPQGTLPAFTDGGVTLTESLGDRGSPNSVTLRLTAHVPSQRKTPAADGVPTVSFTLAL